MDLIVRQISGLGNQLFQYAAGLYYARRYSANLSLAFDRPEHAVSHGYPRPFLLTHFQIPIGMRPQSWQEKLFFSGRRAHGPLNRVLKAIRGVQVITEPVSQHYCFHKELPISPAARVVYLAGYWQAYQIAAAVEPELRRDLSFRTTPQGKTLAVLERIQRCGERSVSLHVRRGDYNTAAEGHRTLPLSYYHDAIQYMRERVADPTFFIFSDDIAFTRQNLPADLQAVFVDHNDDATSHEDLRLMSACRHHILANSSFSWWGAWLNRSPAKMVYAPRFWALTADSYYPDLLPPDWTLGSFPTRPTS